MTKRNLTKIMVFGTFDILHKGHISFFKQARKLAKKPYLIVSVARDKNVKKIKKHSPFYSEARRLYNLKKLKFVDKVVLGSKSGYLKHILNNKPDIVALGYDQKAYTKNLFQKLNNQGLKVVIKRLRPFKAQIYKSSLFLKKML